MSRKIPEKHKFRCREMSCDEYDEMMLKEGKNHFNSYGDYIELNPPEVESDGEIFVKGIFSIILVFLYYAFWVSLVGLVFYGGYWLFFK